MGGRRMSRSRTRDGGIREHDFSGLAADGREREPWWSWWPILTWLLTCCVPGWALSKCGGMHDSRIQGAWREKVALCFIIAFLCVLLAFITFGLSTLVCRPPSKPIFRIGMVADRDGSPESLNGENERWFIIHGMIYNIPELYKPYKHRRGLDPYPLFATMDITAYFPWAPACLAAGVTAKLKCKAPGTDLEFCHDSLLMNHMEHVADLAYEWSDIAQGAGSTRLVHNGEVLDIGQYLDQVGEDTPAKPFGEYVDRVFRRHVGGDATKALSILDPAMRSCIRQQFRAGFLEVKTLGCIITDIVLYVSLVAILTLVLAKFFLAIAFAFVMARRLGRKENKKPPKPRGEADDLLNRNSSSMGALKTSRFSAGIQKRPHYSPATISASAMASSASLTTPHDSRNSLPAVVLPLDSTTSPDHMYTILLVTCYSEGEAGLRTTLDSLTETDYDDRQKLLFIIADGIITGSGEAQSTPDTLVSMLELAHEECGFEGFQFDSEGRPELHSYVAIADGTKRHNMARVYAGYYRSTTQPDRRTPAILVIKCGGPAEVDMPKPGNRGKRDSQLILMGFLSKVPHSCFPTF